MFDVKEINIGRQFEIDVAKAFAVIFMIVIHTFEQLTDMGNETLYHIVGFLGCPPAAGVFMFSMGIGMVYNKHNSPTDFAKRGIKLIIMGIVLNFFRETVLVLAGKILGVANPWENEPILHTLLIIDILQFAGVAFLITAFLKKLKLKHWMIAATAIFLNAIGTLFSGSCEKLPVALQDIFGSCIFTAVEPAFPAFQWYIYPALGICFAHVLRHVTNKNAFYFRMLCLTSAFLAFITIGCFAMGINIQDFYMSAKYYEQAAVTCIWCLAVVGICFPIYYFVSKLIKGKTEMEIKYVSSNVNTIYIVQWLVITYTIAVIELLGGDMVPSEWGIPIGIVNTVASILICMLWKYIKGKLARK